MPDHVSGWKILFEFLQSEAVSLGVAGIAGAVASAMVEWRGPKELIRKVVVGGIAAYYASDLAVPMLRFLLPGIGLDAEKAPNLAAFIMGMFAIVIFEFIYKVIRTRNKLVEENILSRNGQPAEPHRQAESYERLDREGGEG